MRRVPSLAAGLVLLLLGGCAVSPEERLRRADLAMASGHFDEAVEELTEGLSKEPGHAALLEGLGVALARRDGAGDREEAEKRLREALEKNPSSPRAMAELGKILWSSGRREEGLARFRAFLATPISPDPVLAIERAKILAIVVAAERDSAQAESRSALD